MKDAFSGSVLVSLMRVCEIFNFLWGKFFWGGKLLTVHEAKAQIMEEAKKIKASASEVRKDVTG